LDDPANVLDAVVRLARLLDSPAEARFLMPLITREIIYRLLMGEQSARLRHVATLGDNPYRISQAIERLRKDYDQPLRIESDDASQFTREYKRLFGLPPVRDVERLRGAARPDVRSAAE
jgi:hypothetical protein